jgi:hypothetical protein
LITTLGRGESWSAEITSEGRAYLAQVDGPNPPIPRQANESVSQQLIDQVVAAGGTLRLPRSGWARDGVDYAQRARLAQIHGKAPAGKHLRVTAVSHREMLLELVDNESGGPVLAEVAVPERINRLHPVARAFRDERERHEVSRAQLPRATRIVHAIAVEAERRGWEVSTPAFSRNGYGRLDWTGTKDGHLHLRVGAHRFQLRFQERGVHARGQHESDWRYLHGTRTPYDEDATAQLILEIDPQLLYSRSGRQSRFSDRASWQLESRLSQLFLELEERALEEGRAEKERELAAEQAAERARLAAMEREREWRSHVELARAQLIEASRARLLGEQVQAWREAVAVRDFCAAIEAVHPTRPETAAWVEWCRGYADRVDPLHNPPALPAEPTRSAETLQPFMPAGWSAEGPEIGWRYRDPLIDGP